MESVNRTPSRDDATTEKSEKKEPFSPLVTMVVDAAYRQRHLAPRRDTVYINAALLFPFIPTKQESVDGCSSRD